MMAPALDNIVWGVPKAPEKENPYDDANMPYDTIFVITAMFDICRYVDSALPMYTNLTSLLDLVISSLTASRLFVVHFMHCSYAPIIFNDMASLQYMSVAMVTISTYGVVMFDICRRQVIRALPMYTNLNRLQDQIVSSLTASICCVVHFMLSSCKHIISYGRTLREMLGIDVFYLSVIGNGACCMMYCVDVENRDVNATVDTLEWARDDLANGSFEFSFSIGLVLRCSPCDCPFC